MYIYIYTCIKEKAPRIRYIVPTYMYIYIYKCIEDTAPELRYTGSRLYVYTHAYMYRREGT